MASRTDESEFDSLLRALAARRLAVYTSGLAVIVLPRVLRAAFGIEVPATARTLLVVCGLGAMILTYLGERRVEDNTGGAGGGRIDDRRGDARPGTDERTTSDSETAGSASGRTSTSTSTPVAEPKPESQVESGYSRRTRTTVAIGLSGIAIGIYVAVEIDTIVGALFVVGGLLFGQSAFRDGGEA